MDHFTVMCLAPWPLSESEAGVDFVLIQTFLLFIRKLAEQELVSIKNDMINI